jgi:hypothetical protein
MGYSMAVNLRTRMDPSTTLLVCDVNQGAIEKFLKQMKGKGKIEVVKTGKEAASRAVCLPYSLWISTCYGKVQIELSYDVMLEANIISRIW